ncbi:uncharacterized protein G2W53_032526 [Senna tora]|uniref:Uncharacterized protein n=1 Tax=Senna tora TaxID=362788 RepID=A0A834W6E0_9FABA|nr:uncharacterized protein G2W53_032526 [Senna tora]
MGKANELDNMAFFIRKLYGHLKVLGFWAPMM